MGAQLEFYLANRAGQTAIVRSSDGIVVGWVRLGADGLLRGHLKGESVPSDSQVPGSTTTTNALALFVERHRGDMPT